MIKQAPSVGRILTMVAFALSCFGILVFLWLSFGGSVPLKPKGYRVEVSFPEATQLAKEAEVRISGVKVGRVKTTAPNKQTGLTDTMHLCERLMKAVRSIEIEREGSRIAITTSIGVARLAPGHDVAGWLEAADKALYKAKQDGRDRAVTL